jgi:toxin ParE1/3/4
MIHVWAPGAREQANAALSWWATNRPAAPTLLHDELAEAIEQVRTAPLSGKPSRKGTRRVLLPRTRYVLIYRTREARIEIVSLWSMLRGKPPRLGGER